MTAQNDNNSSNVYMMKRSSNSPLLEPVAVTATFAAPSNPGMVEVVVRSFDVLHKTAL